MSGSCRRDPSGLWRAKWSCRGWTLAPGIMGSVAASMSRATRAFHDCGEKNAHDDCVINNSDNASAIIDDN